MQFQRPSQPNERDYPADNDYPSEDRRRREEAVIIEQRGNNLNFTTGRGEAFLLRRYDSPSPGRRPAAKNPNIQPCRVKTSYKPPNVAKFPLIELKFLRPLQYISLPIFYRILCVI